MQEEEEEEERNQQHLDPVSNIIWHKVFLKSMQGVRGKVL